MKYNIFVATLLVAIIGFGFTTTNNGDPTAKEIIQKAEEVMQGVESSEGRIKMTITRPTWTREMEMKTWSKGTKYSLMLITAPARDKGTAFLKRDREMWNWQPSIDRTIKMPPSMMSQSWMGSDFTNDDLVNQSATVTDYDHKIVGKETIEGRECWKIELIPHEEAAIVWGKVFMWISKKDYLQLKTEFYDEDDYLVNTIYGKNIKNLGGKTLTTLMEVVPADDPGNKTTIEYLDLKFDTKISEGFFSVQNMKRVR